MRAQQNNSKTENKKTSSARARNKFSKAWWTIAPRRSETKRGARPNEPPAWQFFWRPIENTPSQKQFHKLLTESYLSCSAVHRGALQLSSHTGSENEPEFCLKHAMRMVAILFTKRSITDGCDAQWKPEFLISKRLRKSQKNLCRSRKKAENAKNAKIYKNDTTSFRQKPCH